MLVGISVIMRNTSMEAFQNDTSRLLNGTGKKIRLGQTASSVSNQVQNNDGNDISKRLLFKDAKQHTMKGLCHSCLTSNSEISVVGGKILCVKCANASEKSSENER